MSYFAEVTHTECVNRMIAIKDTDRERSALELKVLSSLDEAKAAYFKAGGKVDVKDPFAMQDTESEEGKQLRKDILRQYDYNREMKELRAKRGKQ